MPSFADQDVRVNWLINFGESRALAKSARANAIISTTNWAPTLIRQQRMPNSSLPLKFAWDINTGFPVLMEEQCTSDILTTKAESSHADSRRRSLLFDSRHLVWQRCFGRAS